MKTSLRFKTIYRNLPGHLEWEGSFYEILVEYGIWNEDEFWKLHHDLTMVAMENKGEKMDRILAAAIVKICLRVVNSIAAHYNDNDVFTIENLDDMQLIDFKERFEMAVMGAFSGEVLDESHFDLKNPLLINT